MVLEREAVLKAAEYVGGDWTQAPYYDHAEPLMDWQWPDLIAPMIAGFDFRVTVDLAAGHGRNSARLLKQPGLERLYVVDINQTNVDFCKNRFGSDDRVEFIKNDGVGIPEIPDGTVTCFYSFDAMVHFDSDVVRAYLKEASRILQPGGRGFVHHSDDTRNPGGDLHSHVGWRNFMSAELFKHYAIKESLSVDQQFRLNWRGNEEIPDCLSTLRKP